LLCFLSFVALVNKLQDNILGSQQELNSAVKLEACHSECRTSKIRFITHVFQHRDLFRSWISFYLWRFSLWHSVLSRKHPLSVSSPRLSFKLGSINNRGKLICNQVGQRFINQVFNLAPLLKQISLEILQELVVKIEKEMLEV